MSGGSSERVTDGPGGALTGVRVLELGQVIAGPFCGQMLADQGADVIKVEPPRVGDVLRQWGWGPDGEDSLWWRQAARNKRSITVDLRTEPGQQLIRRLAADADVVIENFRPGTLERWGLGYDRLSEDHPELILVRISGFGQTGPYAGRAGYAAIGEAMGGLRALTGYPDRPPTRVGISLGDSLTGLMGAFGAVAALQERHRTGRGQVVDASIFESVLALTEALVPDWVATGVERERSGPALTGIAPSNIYPTRDGEILIAANQDTVFARLASAMGAPELTDDPRFVDHRARGANAADLDALIGEWSQGLESATLLAELHAAGVPCGLLYRPADMITDPHFVARSSLVEIDGQHPITMPNVAPRLSRTPGAVRWTGPQLGEHTDEVLGEAGLTDREITDLRHRGVV